MIEKLSNLSDRQFLLLSLPVSLMLVAPLVLFRIEPSDDSCFYYVPMIDAFVRSDWEYAYHPMISPGLVTLAGLIGSIIPLSSYTASKIVSGFFFAATIFPLFYIQKKVFGRNIATIAVILFIFCSLMLHYAGSGLQDIGKCFSLVFSIFALIHFIERKAWKYVVSLIIGISGLILIRPEGIIIGGVLFLYLIYQDLKRDKKTNRFNLPWKALLTLLLVFLICLPWLVYQYQKIGYPVTHSRIADRLDTMLPVEIKSLIKNSSPDLMQRDFIFPGVDLDVYEYSSEKMMSRSFWDRIPGPVIKGFYRVYLLFALWGIYLRIKKKEWTPTDSLLLIVIVAHTFLMILLTGGKWTLARYIMPAMPLMLGWTGNGVITLLDILRSKFKKGYPINILLLVIALMLVWDGMSDIRPTLNPSKKAKEQNVMETSYWIKTTATTLLKPEWQRLRSVLNHYHNGKKPIIITHEPYLGYLANAEMVHPNLYKETYTLNDFVQLCQAKKVNFVVLDEKLEKICPDLKSAHERAPYFDVIFTPKNDKYRMQVLGFKPHILHVGN